MADASPDRGRLDREIRQRNTLINVLRGVFVVLLFVVTALAIVTDSAQSTLGIRFYGWWWAAAIAVALFFLGVVGLDVLTPRRKLPTISALAFGCVAGLLATIVLALLLDLFRETYLRGFVDLDDEIDRILLSAKVILGLGLCYLGMTTVLQTQDDFRLVIPYVEFAKQYRGARPLVPDTSALVDARLVALTDSGLVQAPVIVPRFVIDELHALSDSSDATKRARGRRGLDTVSSLQRGGRVEVSIDETPSVAEAPGVDQRLIDYAAAMPGVILTTDSGLVRVASVRGASVVNLHDVADAMRPRVLPGDDLDVDLVKRGDHAGQAVGYLEDGTMIVVEGGSDSIGRRVGVRVTSAVQTSAGRLFFARPRDGAEPDGPPAHEAIPADAPPPEPPPAARPEAPIPAEPADPTPGRRSGGPLGPAGPEGSGATALAAEPAPGPGRLRRAGIGQATPGGRSTGRLAASTSSSSDGASDAPPVRTSAPASPSIWQTIGDEPLLMVTRSPRARSAPEDRRRRERTIHETSPILVDAGKNATSSRPSVIDAPAAGSMRSAYWRELATTSRPWRWSTTGSPSTSTRTRA